MIRFLIMILLVMISLVDLSADKLPVKEELLAKQLDELLNTSRLTTAIIEESDYLRHQPTKGIAFPASNSSTTLVDSNLVSDPFGIIDGMNDLVDDFTSDEVSVLDKARLALLNVKAAARFVQKFDGSSILELPVGKSQTFGTTEVTIVLNAIRIYSTHAALEVFVEIDRPDWPTPLIFYSPDIRFTRTGGLSGLSSVGLLGNMAIPLEENKSTLIMRRAIYDPVLQEFTSGTYLQFDCDGFSKMGVAGALAFSKEWLLPVLPNGSVDTVNRVISFFDFEMEENFDNFIAEISIDEFIVPQCSRISWQVEKALFDFSETEKRFDFPVIDGSYDPTSAGNGFLSSTEEWKGVYIETFSIKWVDTLAANTTTSLPSLTGYDILIDHNGFSGFLAITALLPIEEGDIEGWDFSIDLLEVGILQNQLYSFEFEGLLLVPLLKSEEESSSEDNVDAFGYNAYFNPYINNYELSVSLEEDKEFDIGIFKGKAIVRNDSELILSYTQDTGFIVSAILHGEFSIPGAQIGQKKINLPSVEFQGLHIATHKKYIRNIGAWGLPTDAGGQFMGFGYNVQTLVIAGEDEDAEFKVIANINFAANDGVHISAGGAFRIQGKVERDGIEMKQRYNYKTLKVDMIEVAADLTAVSFSGQIIFFRDDEKWGTGFQGKLELYIKGANMPEGQEPSLGMAALALFGTKEVEEDDSYRYFMVDLMVRLGEGILIPNTGVRLRGLGGGVYYHMNQLSLAESIQDSNFDPGDPLSQPDAYTAWMLESIGTSLSGTKYEPSQDVSFGVNATVVIALEKEEAFNANITFTIQMNDSYGIQFIRIKGVANFMSPISWSAPSCSGVSAAIEMNFIFDSSQGIPPGLYASAHIFVNVQSGELQMITGSNGNENAPPEYVNAMSKVCPSNEIHYAGGMELELTKDDWFINLGMPQESSRLSANARLGPLQAALSLYMDIGTNIPAFPGLPANVSHLTQFSNISEAGRATGNGFAFGAAFDLSLIDVEYLVFSASIGLEAGFDVMVKQYDPIYCQDNEPLGINFFYSMGQAYAYIYAQINAFGFEILDLGLAAAMQMNGPNPNWFKGAVSGYYRVGPFGAYEGNCYFVFETGEKCEVDGDFAQSYDLISELLPLDSSVVSVDHDIIAAFNYPLDSKYTEIDENGNAIDYQLVVDNFSILDGNGNQIIGDFLEESFYIIFQPDEMLSSQSYFTANLEVSFKNLSTNEIESQEIKVHNFSTGTSLPYIPESNVHYAYPNNGQFNYYSEAPAETKKIKLKKGQTELFNNEEFGQRVRISSDFPAYLAYQGLTYLEEEESIIFSLPSDLIPGQAYRLQITSYISNGDTSNNAQGNNQGNQQQNQQQIPGGQNPNMPSSNHFIGGDVLPEIDSSETVVYEMFFRKSLFENPEIKYNDFSFSSMSNATINVDNFSEPIGYEELIGFYQDKPSLYMDAILENTSWYENYNPLDIYNGEIEPYLENSGREGYDIAIKDNLSNERKEHYGIGAPSKAIEITQDSIQKYITTANNLSIINQSNQVGTLAFSNNISLQYDIELVIHNDLKYFFDESLKRFNADSILTKVAHLINSETEYYELINYCLNDELYVRNLLESAYQEQLININDIFSDSYFLDVNWPESCSNLMVTNYMLNNEQKFLQHSIERYPLTNGLYPIYFVYRYPRNEQKVHSNHFQISKNSGE